MDCLGLSYYFVFLGGRRRDDVSPCFFLLFIIFLGGAMTNRNGNYFLKDQPLNLATGCHVKL